MNFFNLRKVFYCIWIFFPLINIHNVFSQERKATDTTYFISYPDKIVVKANIDTQTDTYILHEPNDEKFEIASNNQIRFFLSMDYKFVNFSFGFAPKLFVDNDDDRLKGKSSFTDYKFHFFFGKFVQGLEYRRIKGYYVVNTGDFVAGWQENENPYLQFPDLKKTLYGMSTGYIFNERFSYRNLNSPTQWQRKSAGSFVPMLYYDYSKFENKFLGEKSVEHQINSRLALSYYYTLVLAEKWFATPNLSTSVGVRFSNYKDTDAEGIATTEKDTYFMRALEGGLQLGFDSPRIFAGANLNFNVNWYDEDSNSHVENDQVYGLFYVGYRFDAAGFIERPIQKAEDKMQEKLESLKKDKTER